MFLIETSNKSIWFYIKFESNKLFLTYYYTSFLLHSKSVQRYYWIFFLKILNRSERSKGC